MIGRSIPTSKKMWPQNGERSRSALYGWEVTDLQNKLHSPLFQNGVQTCQRARPRVAVDVPDQVPLPALRVGEIKCYRRDRGKHRWGCSTAVRHKNRPGF